MADSTITDLPAAAALAGTEPVPIDQAGATVRATLQAIANLALASPAFTGTPTTPTAPFPSGTTQIANCTYVNANYAQKDDPNLDGSTHLLGDFTAALAGDVNDYSPDAADPATVWTLTSSANVTITGIAPASQGRLLFINNINASGGFSITLKNDSSLSVAGNRFAFAADIVLAPGEGVVLNRVNSRWRAFGEYGLAAVGGGGDVSSTLTLTAGAGLTGGGTLAANRTFDVVGGAGITVSADAVALTTPVAIANGGTGTTTGISTATQTALNLKADLASPTFTGTPAAPTASPGTSTTQLATTAFVSAAVTGGSVADGNKGDITVSGSGSVWNVNSGAVAIAEVSGLTAALDAKADDADLAGKASTVHTHVMADVTDLAAAMTLKADDTDLALKLNVDDPSFTGELLTNTDTIYASITADQNNYAPDAGDLRSFWRIQSDAPRKITGIDSGVNGKFLYITNDGLFPITLVQASTSSVNVNRFRFYPTQDIVLGQDQSVLLMRWGTGTAARWKALTTPAPRTLVVACSDETTALTAGTAKTTFRMPFGMYPHTVRASLTTAQTSGATFTIDINEAGVSILSTKLTIDNTEKTSTTAAVPAVLSDTVLADDAEITVDIDAIGDGTAKGLKITLIG